MNYSIILAGIMFSVVIGLLNSVIMKLTNKIDYDTKTNKSFLQPPGWIFGVMWTFIYFLYGMYGYSIYKSNNSFKIPIMILYVVNLIMNLSWSPLVFGYKKYIMGVYVIWVIIYSLIAMMVMTKNTTSTLYLVPYISWLILAMQLNIDIAKNNTLSTFQ